MYCLKFIACDKYPDCKTTFKMPPNGKVQTSEKICPDCNHPMLKVTKKKSHQEICINENCPSKRVQDEKKVEELKAIHNGDIERTCPTCKKGKLVLRKSIYGAFYGCSNYPKCKYTEKIEDKKEEQKDQ
jgi:DNA topoisomerase-1